MHFDHVAANPESSGSTLKDRLVRLRRHLEESIVEARRFVWDLRHPLPIPARLFLDLLAETAEPESES